MGGVVIRDSDDEDLILSHVAETLTPLYQIGPNTCHADHDIGHIQRMLKIAELIYDPEKVDLFKLQLSIWFHNLDRVKGQEPPTNTIYETLKKFNRNFNLEEIAELVDVEEKHSKLPTTQDSQLLIHLKDCDMLDMGAIGLMRIAATDRPIPIYHLNNFSEKTTDTTHAGLKSMINDIDRCLEWVDLGMIRTPKGIKLARKRFAFMRLFREELKRELQEIGII